MIKQACDEGLFYDVNFRLNVIIYGSWSIVYLEAKVLKDGL